MSPPRNTGSGDAGPSPRKSAMDLLARREHAYAELERKLAGRFDAQELIEALDGLRQEGLQSDERFARSYTRERLLRGMGPQRIRAELRQRGVEACFIDDALDAVPAEEGTSWSELARSALGKKYGRSRASDYPERARRARFLEQRGFAGSEAFDDLF